ncbi:MAG: RsmB/NOP family class I SAM-dependent RNA methyltransferase [Planctomycetota bacterium]|nr:RsmB/NOP family class I SAM-dependent RNA methyltransferase [Planctomycetota bacterium]
MSDISAQDTNQTDDSGFPPAGLVDRLAEVLPGTHLAAFLEGVRIPEGTWLRVNTLRSSVEQVLGSLRGAGITCEASDWCAEAIRAEASVRDVQQIGGWDRGLFHIQSPSSIAAVIALDPRPGERILDMCAAPGSKTSHLGAVMRNEGHLVANDLSKPRAHRLRSVLELLGARAEVRVGPGERIGRREPETYDRVLVDAPCSGEGMMSASDPRSFSNWRPRTPARLASRQKSLLHSAIDAVKPGGTVVYSTCTFAPEENELVVERALKVYRNRIELEPIEVAFPGRITTCREFRGRALPNRPELVRLAPPEMDGFFLARFRKVG